MDEFKFVLRCFAFAALVLVFSQIKAGDTTIEGHIQASLLNSKVSGFVNKVADGGVKLIRDGSNYVVESYREWKRSENGQPEVPKTAKAVTELSTQDDDTESYEVE